MQRESALSHTKEWYSPLLPPPQSLGFSALHLYIILGVKVYHGPFKYRPVLSPHFLTGHYWGSAPPPPAKPDGASPLSAAHTLALLLGLPRPSTSKARGATLLRQTKVPYKLNEVLSHPTNKYSPLLPPPSKCALYDCGGRGFGGAPPGIGRCGPVAQVPRPIWGIISVFLQFMALFVYIIVAISRGLW